MGTSGPWSLAGFVGWVSARIQMCVEWSRPPAWPKSFTAECVCGGDRERVAVWSSQKSTLSSSSGENQGPERATVLPGLTRQALRGPEDTRAGSAFPEPSPSTRLRCRFFLEAGGSFKARACCQSDLVSMEAASGAACCCQPEAWWSLRP